MDNEDYHTFESSLSKEGLIYMDVAASGVKRYINILQKKGYKDYKDVYKLLLFINLYEIFYEPFVNGTPGSPKEAELHFGNMFYKLGRNYCVELFIGFKVKCFANYILYLFVL